MSSSDGWVAGADGILATTDGGQHWLRQFVANGPGLASVDFLDADHGWAVGSGQFITTADGGRHWRRLPEPCPELNFVHFVSPSVGFAVAGGAIDGGVFDVAPPKGGVLLSTSDGGRSWSSLSAPSDVQSVCFSDTKRGWLGAGGRIFGSVDGGHHWSVLVADKEAVDAGVEYVALTQCAGPNAAWAELIGGGMMSQQPHIGFHIEGGAATAIFAEGYFPHPGIDVSAESPGAEAGPFSAISPTTAVFIDYCDACGWGNAPMDVASDRGSVLTSHGNLVGITDATGASFLDPNEGWVVGIDTVGPATPGQSVPDPITYSQIVHTSDGGRTWQTQYSVRNPMN